MSDNNGSLLRIEDLKTHFFTADGVVRAVDGVSFEIAPGQTLGLVGESGCGKSVTAFSILQIVGRPGRIVSGRVLFHRPLRGTGDTTEVVDLAALHPRGEEMRQVRGGEIAMIFQEPMSSLSMMHTVGFQIEEALHLHSQISRQDAHDKAIEMLGRVGIPRPEERVNAYPFELSGGMRQRAMIAMALCCNPSLLIADEPTTALDVTTQAQILDLMASLQEDLGMAIMLITHDLELAVRFAGSIVVFYAGTTVEEALAADFAAGPAALRHPYSQALWRALPQNGFEATAGSQPHAGTPLPGCLYAPRCPLMTAACTQQNPPLRALRGGMVRCIHAT